MKKIPVGLQLYSVRDAMARDFEGTLRAVKDMGYEAVEFAGLFGKDPLWIRDLCRELSLCPVSAHVPFAEMKEDPEGTFALYKALGCTFVAVPYLASEDRPGVGDFEKTIKEVALLAEKAKAAGLTLLYHNHDFEFVRLQDGRYGLDALYEEIPEALLKTELDTCWVNVAGEDPGAYIKKYAGRAPVVHLKDFVMPGKKPAKMYALIGIDDGDGQKDEEAFSFRPVGYGAQKVEELLLAAEAAGSDWLIVEQDAPSLGKSPLECAKMSIDYLKELMN